MKKSDILAALIIGEASAWLALAIFKNIRFSVPFWWAFPIFLPVLAIVGLWAACFMGRRFLIIFQAAKFILVGFLNTLVDLGALNLLILFSGLASGIFYSIFKGISFTIAVINSYYWNKFWTFRKSDKIEKTEIKNNGGELLQFLMVSVVGFGINVGVASFVVNYIGPQLGFGDKIWANVAAIIATLSAMVWNFFGYKFIVFRK